MNWDAITSSLPTYLDGALLTLQLLGASLLLGLVVALPLALLRASANAWANRAVWCFTYVIRGTPMLVQLFLIYYGLAQFPAVRESVLWPWLSQAWFCAVLAFGINTCAYTVEIIAGCIRATPHGEVEAARAMGLTTAQTWRRILLPSALRRALPAYSNEVIMMLHGTSLASIVTLLDLTGVAREVNSRFYAPFEAFITAAVFYLALTFLLVGLFHLAERRWLKHLRPRTT
ncbi:MAG: ABC transporter permease [Burkholderiales bacterium]|nr:ABC transporter permease [Burkholderiales bacterium]